MVSGFFVSASILSTQHMVWMNGLEPTTPCMSSKCSNQLSYTHIAFILYTILFQNAIGKSEFPQKKLFTAKGRLTSGLLLFYRYAGRTLNFFTPQLLRT